MAKVHSIFQDLSRSSLEELKFVSISDTNGCDDLFLVYLDGATQFAQSCGGGGTSSDLPWGRNPDEDDRRFAYRCMIQAHKMQKLTHPKRDIVRIH